MKIERKQPKFEPITITIESELEWAILKATIATSVSQAVFESHNLAKSKIKTSASEVQSVLIDMLNCVEKYPKETCTSEK